MATLVAGTTLTLAQVVGITVTDGVATIEAKTGEVKFTTNLDLALIMAEFIRCFRAEPSMTVAYFVGALTPSVKLWKDMTRAEAMQHMESEMNGLATKPLGPVIQAFRDATTSGHATAVALYAKALVREAQSRPRTEQPVLMASLRTLIYLQSQYSFTRQNR